MRKALPRINLAALQLVYAVRLGWVVDFFLHKPANAPLWKRHRYFVPLAIATLLYLTVEFAFNARLLDAAGGLASPNAIESMERWGRFLSGFAVALALDGLVVLPLWEIQVWRSSKLVVVLAVVTSISMSAVYYAEKAFVDHLAQQSSAQFRWSAIRLQFMTQAVKGGDLKFKELSLDEHVVSSPEGKSFLAMMPALLYALPDLHERLDPALKKLVDDKVSRNVGSPSYYYNRYYLPSVVAIKKAYNEYVDGVSRYHQAMANIPNDQARAWRDYESALSKHGWTPDSVPRLAYGRVRSSVRSKGVDVPQWWRPDDRDTFYEAVARTAKARISDRYQRKAYVLPLDLSFSSFVRSEQVQRQWSSKLHADPRVPLTTNMSLSEVTKVLYDPVLKQVLAEKEASTVGRLAYPVEAFADGRQFSDEGISAVKSLIVPPIALAFSLMGAVFHILKSLLLLLSLPFKSDRARRFSAFAIAAALVVAPIFSSNQISKSPAFEKLASKTADKVSPLAAGGMTWIVKIEPYSYPVAEWLRVNVLQGYSFGYE